MADVQVFQIRSAADFWFGKRTTGEKLVERMKSKIEQMDEKQKQALKKELFGK